MTHRPLPVLGALAITFCLLTPLAQAAADTCRPAPLGNRILYVRGTVNDWRADDDWALLCDKHKTIASAERAVSPDSRRRANIRRAGLIAAALSIAGVILVASNWERKAPPCKTAR